MGRKPKSTNKYISLKLRKEYDSILLVDKDFDEEPSQTLLRLYKSYKKLTYLIFHVNYVEGQIEPQDINNYVRIGKKIRPSSPDFDIVFKVGRNNNALKDELQAFYYVTRDYILNNLLKEDVTKSKIMITKYLGNLERTIKHGIEETQYWNDPKIQSFEFEHIFLLHSRGKKYMQMQHPDNFDDYLNENRNYFIRIRSILHSWHIFWKAHLPYIKYLKKLFTSEGTFKLQDGISYQNEGFTNWLEEGLLKYIEPISPKMNDDAMLIKYLKYIILSGQHTKPNRKSQ